MTPIANKLTELAALVDEEAKPTLAGYTQLPVGVTDVDQVVIPRYANGKTHPAGGLIGDGPAHVLRGSIMTPTLAVPAVVITEDYATAEQSQWQSGSFEQPTHLSAVLQPQLRNLTISGHDETASGYTKGGIVNTNVGQWTPASTHPDKFDLARIRASGPTIQGVRFYYAAGTCLTVSRGGGRMNGELLPFDNEKFLLADCTFQRAYRGCLLETVDGVIRNLSGQCLRDYGLKITGGAIQLEGSLHFWGVFGGSTAAIKSPAIWFAASAGPCWGGPMYPETSDIGLLIESSGNRFHGVYSHSCPHGSILLSGQRNVISGFEVHVAAGTTTKNGKPGILLAGQYHTLRDGHVNLADGETGIQITNGNHIAIDGVTILGASKEATGTGIEVKDTLNKSLIRAHVQWLGKGVGVSLWDGTKSTIGRGNTLLISHDESSMSAEAAVRLPPGWSTVPRSTTNDVRINGRRQFPTQDEF